MLKIFKMLKPFTLTIFIILILIFLQTLGDLYLPTLMSDIINKGVMEGDIPYIWKIGGLMLLIAFIGGGFSIIATLLGSKVSMKLGSILRDKVFKKVESFSLHEFDKFGTATLITRSTNDITQIQTVMVIILRMMIGAPLMALGGIILAYSKDKKLTLVLAVAIPVMFIIIIFMAKKVIPLFKLVQIKVDKINLVLREKLTGIRVIRAFNTIEKENLRFEDANLDLTNNYIKINKIMAYLMPSIMLIMNFTTLAILWFGILLINKNDMDIGALVAFTQYAMQIMFSMLMLSMMFVMLPRAQAASTRINEVLETIPEILEKDDALDCSTEKGHIEFKNVTFSYHNAEKPAIENISFKANPGEITAIIGSTGAGKSTLINLIPRFYDTQSGSVLIDGIDVKDMTQECLRKKIGFVPQKAILFSGTVTENIKVGNDYATDDEIFYAASIAQATNFINEMDEGFSHKIEQAGINLSGGQKQRLSIARALVRKPEIYIFDDSFSALNFKTDAALRAALKKEIKTSTILIVAQRIGTVMDADRIIVLDDGQIVGIGTHKELMNNCSVYQEIVSSQLSKEEIK